MNGELFDMTFKVNELPTIEYLNECFVYDAENGILFWKERPLHHFKNFAQYKRWNKIHANKIAGTPDRKSKNGKSVYRAVNLINKKYREHRIIFKLFYGYDPEFIDHINGDRKDNRISNLNSVNLQENAKNKGLSKNNTSGINCIRFNNIRQSWIVDLGTLKSSNRTTKAFKTFEEAVACRKAWEKENGYHENHGKERNMY